MDKGTKRNLAVTAGLTAVLALSPVAGPVVTALADDATPVTDVANESKTEDQPSTITIRWHFNSTLNQDVTEEYAYGATIKDITLKSYLAPEGMMIVGWYTDPDCENEYYFSSNKPQYTDLDLYAKWGSKTVTIKFWNALSYDDMDELSPYKEETTTRNQTNSAITLPSSEEMKAHAPAEGYSFDGWYTDKEFTKKITDFGAFPDDMNLYAKWFEKPTVSYYLSPDQDTPFYSEQVEYSGSATVADAYQALKPLIPEGYKLDGWFTDPEYTVRYSPVAPGSKITEDKSLYAKFDRQPTVTYEFVDESGKTLDTTTPESVNLFDYADARRAPEGYRVDGYADGEGSPIDDITSYEIKGDTTITVKCVKLATVTFNYGDAGIDDTRQVVDTGKTVSKPADPTREGYDFAGWYTDAECTQPYDFATPVTGDMTLYAKWIQDEETTEPEQPGEGTEQPGTGTEEPGEGTETPETPGTGTETPGTGTEEPGTETPAAEIHKVTFDDCLASTENAVVEVEDGKTVAKPADPKCEGYTFEGWYSDTNLTQAWDFSTPVTEDMTLWAKWSKNGVDGAGVTDDTKTPLAPDKGADKTASDKTASDKSTLPSTGDATMAVSGLGALGTAVAGLGAFLKRRH